MLKDEVAPRIVGLLTDRPNELKKKLRDVKEAIDLCKNAQKNEELLQKFITQLLENVPEVKECFGEQAHNDLI